MLDIGSDDTPHDQAEALLPWYATGKLDDDDRALVEQHLHSCASCQRQLFAERRLIDEYRDLSPHVDSGWARLLGRIERPAPAPRPRFIEAAAEIWQALTRPPVIGFVAAQAVFLLLGASLFLSLSRPAQPTYHALGASQAPASANLLVMFRPDATDKEIAGILRSSHASVVGGPTPTDAWLLHVPASQRPKAVAALQSDPHVQLAQPIDEAAG